MRRAILLLALTPLTLIAGAFAATVSAAPSPLSPEGRLAQLNLREQALTADLGNDRGRLSVLLSGLMLFRRQPPPALLVSPGDARDAVNAAILIRAITPELRRRADVLAAQGRQLAAIRRDAAAAEAETFTAESERADLRGSLPLDDQGGDSALLAGAAASGPPQPKQPLPPLLSPAEGEMVRRFGDAVVGGGRARGVSIRTEKGATVRSPAAGTVEYAGEVNGWGVVLILRTAGAYHLVLAGLDQSNALPGQSVAAGAVVGKVADGGSSPPELYFEVREGATPVDPVRWLPKPAAPHKTVAAAE